MNKFRKNINNNLKSGITISLVSIPIAISLAVASGVTPIAGIITAIWAGLIASIFGGSNYNIIGPTGALSGIIALYALEFGPHYISTLAIFSGFFILFAYLLRLEKFLVFIPSSVIHGFTLGVALIIIMNQINYVLGLNNLPKHENIFHNLFESLKHLQNSSFHAFIIFLIFFICLIIFRKLIPKFPGIIFLTPLGILLGYLTTNQILPINLQTLSIKFGELSPQLFNFPKIFIELNLLIPAIVIAIIAILETMLSAKIADSLTSTRHDSRKEMFGLGLSNITSGIMGGIPATAALARTALNIKTGATHKLSATISSIFIIIWSILFLGFFKYFPMPVIAAILVYVSINMIEREHFDRLWLHDKTNFFISMIVAFATVYKDPIFGILLGAGLSLLFFVEKISHAYYEITTFEKKEFPTEFISSEESKEILKNKNAVIYKIKGKLVYINSQAHIIRFETDLNKFNNIILSLKEVYFIDIDGIDALDEIIDFTIKNNQKIYFVGLRTHIQEFLKETSKHFKNLEKNNFVLNNINEALLKIK